MSCSSPITSVPDPSETSSSPLASIITQVQPNQASSPRSAIPRASAQALPKKKKKKKKKKKSTSPTTSAGAAVAQEQAVAEAARLGCQAAHTQARSHSSSSPLTTAGAAEEEAAGQHLDPPCSTIVASSSAGNTLTPTTAPVGAERVGNAEQDKAAAATESSHETLEKDGLIDVPTSNQGAARATVGIVAAKQASTTASATASTTPIKTATPNPTATTARNNARVSKQGGKKPGLAAKLMAFLTCSSASSAQVQREMSEKKPTPAATTTASARNAAAPTTPAATSTGAVVVPAPTPNPKNTANPKPDYPTTPGGGTKLPEAETGDVMSGAVVPPGSSFVTAPGGGGGEDEMRKSRASSLHHPASSCHSGDETRSETDNDDGEEEMEMESDYLTDDQTEEQRLILSGGIGIPLDQFGNACPLLPPIFTPDSGRKCLVLDLDETLVHSSFKMIQNADFIVPVEIDGTVHKVYVIKRPGVDEFMRQMGLIYEVVVFTASLSKYADPVLDMLDIHHSVRHRLFRESCYNHKGNYVKDLSQLGRDVGKSIIIDNSPASYIFHPNNAVPVSSWFNDPHDTELTDLMPFLADLANVDDVRAVLDGTL